MKFSVLSSALKCIGKLTTLWMHTSDPETPAVWVSTIKHKTPRARASPRLLGLKWLMRKDDNISPVALCARGWVFWGDECCVQPFWLMPKGCWQLPQQVLPHAQGAQPDFPRWPTKGSAAFSSQIKVLLDLQSPVEVPHVVYPPLAVFIACATMPVVDIKPQPICATCSVLWEKENAS